MPTTVDRDQSLEQLEAVAWDKPSFESSLVLRCHDLRRKPLRDLAVDDLRLLIGQKIGLEFLVPLALEHLQQDPLVAGSLFRGDLLAAVLRIEEGFWNEHDDMYWLFREVLGEVQSIADLLAAENERLTILLTLKSGGSGSESTTAS